MQQKDKFSKFEQFLSKERLDSYSTYQARFNNIDPLTAYSWNIELSESLYPLLHIIEIALRNSLYNAIAKHFGKDDWMFYQGFLAKEEYKQIEQQITTLRIKGKLDKGHLIAELSFGFWTSLLDRRYELKQLLWPKLLREAFPTMENRKIHLIRKRFNKIRRLRNRVFHYEPIWHWEDLAQQYFAIIDAISWFEPELTKLIDEHRFIEIYQRGPRSISEL